MSSSPSHINDTESTAPLPPPQTNDDSEKQISEQSSSIPLTPTVSWRSRSKSISPSASHVRFKKFYTNSSSAPTVKSENNNDRNKKITTASPSSKSRRQTKSRGDIHQRTKSTENTHVKTKSSVGNCESLIKLQQKKFFNKTIKEFYEDDEICRKNRIGKLEFGIVSRDDLVGSGQNDSKDNFKVFWTLDNEIIEEEELDTDAMGKYENYRLIDRKAEPGDIIYVGKKRGEVTDVSWSSYLRILENGMSLLDIPCERLQPLIPHYRGQRIELDGWIGTVISIETEATLMFPGARSGVVDCSSLPAEQQPYPGRKVSFTHKQYVEAGLQMLDGSQVSEIFGNQVDKKKNPDNKNDALVEAFVLFLHVSQIEVKWNGKLAPTRREDSAAMPSTTLTRGQLRKRVRILGTHADMDWENNLDAVERFYEYIVQPDDLIITDSRENMTEEYMAKKYFNYEAELENPSKTVVRKLIGGRDGGDAKVVTNVSYIVKVLRFSRVLHVKWTDNGRMDKVRASRVTVKHSFKRPYHQFVQKKITLAPYSYDEFGVTTGHDINDHMTVKWLTKHIENHRDLDRNEVTERPPEFREKYHVQESVYDLQPHFAYGNICPKQIVFRNLHCRLPEALFTVGWVQSVNKEGQVIVMTLHSRQEVSVYPNEIGLTGMKIANNEETGSSAAVGLYKWRNVSEIMLKNKMVDLYGVGTLKNADKHFVKNLQNYSSEVAEEETDSNVTTIPTTATPDRFVLLPVAPNTHTFYHNRFDVRANGKWMKAAKKDQVYLTKKIGKDGGVGGIWIKGFRDRLDLFAVLMAAPSGTPYEGGLYEFDIQLVNEYPASPPAIYLTTVLSVGGGCTGKNNCRSILRPGIHSLELGFDENGEVPETFKLVECLREVQSKIFHGSLSSSLEPPSSAGSFHKRSLQLKTKDNDERETNALILIDVLDLMFRMVMDPPLLWTNEVISYFLTNFERMKKRLMALIHLNNSTAYSGGHEDWLKASFPMMPLTSGFSEAVFGRIKRFEELIEQYQKQQQHRG